MNNLPPRLEKYDKEGWYRYLHRAVNLKNAPNLDLDMNVFTRCIVGRCRKGAIYFSEKNAPETYCWICKDASKMFHKMFADIMDGQLHPNIFSEHLDIFFDHMEKVH